MERLGKIVGGGGGVGNNWTLRNEWPKSTQLLVNECEREIFLYFLVWSWAHGQI